MEKKVNYSAPKEMANLNVHMDALQDQISTMTVDKINSANAPKREQEPQAKISKREAEKYDAPYIKPVISFAPNAKPKASQDAIREKAWKYVKVICENNEVKGERIEAWIKPAISGEACNFWQIPVNRPIYLPFHVAEHISKRTYHRLKMTEKATVLAEGEVASAPTGVFVVEEIVNRLDCRLAGMDFASGF